MSTRDIWAGHISPMGRLINSGEGYAYRKRNMDSDRPMDHSWGFAYATHDQFGHDPMSFGDTLTVF